MSTIDKEFFYDIAADHLEGHWEVLRDDQEPDADLVEGAIDKLNRGKRLDQEELRYTADFLEEQAEDLSVEDWPDLKPAARYFKKEMEERGMKPTPPWSEVELTEMSVNE